MKKTIIWDLFGGLNGSLGLALNNDEKYEIYTIDILPKTKDGRENKVIDLAQENVEKLLSELAQLPTPHIITSSPMCQSFSRASTCQGGNASWIVDEFSNTMKVREDHSICKRNYNSERLINNAHLGARAISNTITIIEFVKQFNNDVKWYIENPKSSMIWDFINQSNTPFFEQAIKNDTNYNNYGAPYKKPTRFLSNIDLDLSQENKKGEISFEYHKGGYDNRSDIPQGLLTHIINKMEEA